MRILGVLAACALSVAPPAGGSTVAPMTLDAVVAAHLEARGGAERWRQVQSLRAVGTYAAFSLRGPFELVRQRDDRYRLDFVLLEAPAVRARDAEGVWWQHKLLQPTPARLEEGPYLEQLRRESWFGPLLLDPQRRGVAVTYDGVAELEGTPCHRLTLTLPDGRIETWWLDGATLLEVAIDGSVHDFTQSGTAVEQRIFFDDFREVDGLVLPHRIDFEFGHRLESMIVDRYEIDPVLDPGRFSLPVAAAPGD